MSTIFGIDIGSNSVRLAKIVDGVSLYKEVATTKLAKGIKDSVLDGQSIKRTIEAVCRFAKHARSEGVEPFVFATAAVRTAANGAEFVRSIQQECGLCVDVISGGLEAKLSYIGAGGYGKNGCTVLDIGGASTEVISGIAKQILYQNSFFIGVSELRGVTDTQDLQKIINYAIPELSGIAAGRVYAVGGTATTLAAMDLRLAKYDPIAVSGYCIEREKLKQTALMLLQTPVKQIRTLPGIQPQRADTIAQGAYLLYMLLKKLRVRRCFVCDGDNLEGYAVYKGLV